MHTIETKYQRLISKFQVKGNNITCLERYGEGHINETYLLIMDDKYQYIFQKINHFIFKNVEMLMSNISLVTSYLKDTIYRNNGDINRETMNLVLTNEGKTYLYDKELDGYFRIYIFVSDSVTLQECSSSEIFKESARGFAKFAKDLSNFDASKLGDILPNFHNTKLRYQHFLDTLEKDSAVRANGVAKEIEFVKNHQDICSLIVDALDKKEIPLHVTHNDTKLNNVLFDKNTNKALCVIDLDTVMPGSILYDFGDSIRFGCNPAGENERNLSKVNFRIDLYKAYVDGYLEVLGENLSIKEKELLPYGAMLMTLECGIRFLDDYLDGDHYFHINNSDDNLVRARTQFKLVQDMENCLEEMKKLSK